MRKLNQRETVLLVGLGVVLLAVLYFGQGGGGFGSAPAGDDQTKKGGLGGDPPVVNLASIDLSRIDYRKDGRDLFKYAVRPPSRKQQADDAARRKKDMEDKQNRLAQMREKSEREAKVRQAQNNRPQKPKEPTPPSANFKYIGYLGPLESRIAVFEDGKDLLLASAGDTIKEDFTLQEFGFEKVVLGYTEEKFKDKTTELELERAAAKRSGGGGGSKRKPKSRRRK